MTELHESKEYFYEKTQLNGANVHSKSFKGDKCSVTNFCKKDNKSESETGGGMKKESPLQHSLPKLTNLLTADKQVDISGPSTECSVHKQPTESTIHHANSKVAKEKTTSSVQEAKSSQNETLNCTECGKKYKHYSSLYKHRQQVHSSNSTGQITCKEYECLFSCRFISALRQHLVLKHEMKMEEKQLVFSTYDGMQYDHSICIHYYN